MESNEAKQAVTAAVSALLSQLEAGKSESLTAYLETAARFHHYSFGNIMLIARQKPSASRVAGFQAWKKLGRYVRKGEKGIAILAPLVGKRHNEETGEETPAVYGFRTVFVFDVSQTDGAALPDFDYETRGEPGELLPRLYEFAASKSIVIEREQLHEGTFGYSQGGKIVLTPDLSAADEFSTLAHELAHEILHRIPDTRPCKTVRELEAESVSFIVSRAIGLELRTSCSDYIQMYGGDVALFQASLERIQSTASEMLDAVIAPAEDQVRHAA